jgi:hypothetical protein
MCLMLGRFAVETTNLSPTDGLTLQSRGNMTMKVNGASMGTGTTVQPAFDQTLTYGFVPAPAARSSGFQPGAGSASDPISCEPRRQFRPFGHRFH